MDIAKIARATEHPVYAANQPKILAASHVVVFCARTTLDAEDFNARLPESRLPAATVIAEL